MCSKIREFMDKPSPFQLGPWRVEPLRNRVLRPGEEPRRITPKAMEVLLRLMDEAGEVVRRDEILDSVWPGTHVGEEVLTRAISDLRAALGDDSRRPRFIETIPKMGYRLAGEVRAAATVAAGKLPSEPVSGPLTLQPNGSRRRWAAAGVGTAALAILLVMVQMVQLSRSPGPEVSAAPGRPATDAGAVTQMEGFESYHEVSPEGDRVAFTWRGPAGDNADIYVVPVHGGESGETELQRITRDPATEAGATWSPDGRRLAFGRYRGNGECEILEAALDGGPLRSLGSCGRNGTADFAWSPDGEWIAFSDRTEEDESYGIYLLSTITGETHKLVAPDGQHWGDRDPSFSPDGEHLAFTRSVSMATSDVFRIATRGGEVTRITRDGRPVRGHTWSPEGAAVIVSSRRTAARGLWRYPLSGGAPEWLPVPADHAWRPSLSRTGGSLVFENRRLQASLSRLLPGKERPLEVWLATEGEDLHPRHSPDGRQVAFASNRSGFFEIWVAGATGGDATRLTGLGGSFSGAPAWSPDGQTIVFDARLDGQADLYAVPAAGGVPERLTEHAENDLAPSFSAGGAVIYFGSNRSGRWEIWRRDVRSGRLEQVTSSGGYRALESADGEWLYYTKYGTPGLFRMSTGGGPESPVPGSEALIGADDWTMTAEGACLLIREGDLLRLIRIGDQGTEELATAPGELLLMAGLSVSPTSGDVLVSQMTRMESDLWRVTLPLHSQARNRAP